MKNPRQNWKPKAIHAAIAIACTHGLFALPAMAVGYCGPNADSLPEVVTSMAVRCQLPEGTDDDVVVNSGVTISTTDTDAVYYSGDLGYSSEGETHGSLTNNGTISAQVNNSDTEISGVLIDNELIGTLTNNHLISATASNTEGDAFAAGVLEKSEYDAMQGSLVNNGTISATATASGSDGAAVGISVNNQLAADAVITNNASGLISATVNAPTGIAAGIAISQIDGTINNHGTIQAVLNNTMPTSGIEFAAGVFAWEFNGTLNNSGLISGVAADGGEGNSLVFYVGTGVVNNLATGVLSGRIYTGAEITVNNAGTIDLPLDNGSGAIPTSGLIEGDYNQTSTGVLKITAQSAGEGGYSQLAVGGTATIAGKAFVDVKTVNTLVVGQKLSSVVSAGTLSGNFASVGDNSALFNFTSVVNDNAIDFDVIKGMTVLEATTNTGNNPAAGAASVFDALIGVGSTGNAQMDAIVTQLGQFTTEEEVSNAVSQTLPLHTGGQAVAIGSSLRSVNRIVQSRQEGQHGRSSGDEFVGNKQIWVKPFGSTADQDDKGGVSGYTANTSGIVFGMDSEVQSINRLGGALAITRANVDGNSVVAPQSSTVDSYQLMAYGSRSLSDFTDVNFQAGIGRHSNKGNRSILFAGSRANADYNSLSFHFGGGIAHTLKLNEKTSLTPSLRADYTRVRDSSYTETGAGALNLAVGTNNTEEFIISADAKLTHQLQEHTLLTANFGAGYDAMNQQASITSAYAGAPSASFATQGLKPSAWLVRAGLGVVHSTATGLELTARYDVESRESFINQTVSAKLRWSF